jgi:uncharacterized protein (TIGR03083 family)
MSSRADQTITALRTGHDDFVAVVSELEPADLTRTSGSSDWTVAQVLSHLGSGAEIFLGVLDGALAGTGAPGGDFNKSVWARWDAMSPAEQAANFRNADEVLLRRYEGLDERTREELRIDFGFLPQPVDVAFATGLRLSEYTLHSWDVRVALDPAATAAPEAVALLLDSVGPMLRRFAKADHINNTVRLAVHTTDPSRSFGLVIADEVSFSQDVPTEPNGELTTPAEYLIRLFAGRHDPAHTPATVTLTSNAITLDDLRRVFPGY